MTDPLYLHPHGQPGDNTVSRRQVFQASGAVAAGLALSATSSAGAHAEPQPSATDNAVADTAAGFAAFQHGVASGDPYPRSVILWTRVTSTPDDAPGAGRGRPVHVQWDVARDPEFHHIVTTGSAMAEPAHDNTVKVEAMGLEPYTAYYYRFRALGQTSPTGRTQTAPAPGQKLPALRIALLSCANWEAGYFQPYADLAQRGHQRRRRGEVVDHREGVPDQIKDKIIQRFWRADT